MLSDQLDERDEAILRKVAWRLVPFLMVCYAIAYLDRVNVGVAKLVMTQDLGISEAVFGLGAGIFFIGYFLFEIPSNIMLHRMGARIWIARIMISWAIASAACAFVSGPISFSVARFMLGVTEAGFFPGVILYLTYWFPAAYRGRIVALFMTAIPLAGLVGTPVSGAIMSLTDGMLGIEGWRWMLFLEAVPPLLLGLAVPFVLQSNVKDARWLSEEEKQRLGYLLSREAAAPDGHGGILDCLKDPAVLRFALIYFCCIMGQYGITFWLPTMVAGMANMPPWLVGLYSSLPYGCAIIAMMWTGRHSDRHGERRWHLIGPMLIGAAALAVMPFAGGGIAFSIALLCVAAAGVLTATPLFWNLPTSVLGGTSAAVGIAAINSVGNLAGFTSPAVIGWLSDHAGGMHWGVWFLSAVLLTGMCLVPGRAARPATSQG